MGTISGLQWLLSGFLERKLLDLISAAVVAENQRAKLVAWDEIPLVHEITARMQQWQQAAARREARERRAVRAIQRAWRAIPPESASASRRATRTSAASMSQA